MKARCQQDCFCAVALGLGWLLPPPRALAHPGRPAELHDYLQAWEFDPATLVGLGGVASIYALGVTRLWRHAGVGRAIRRWQAACFAAGWSLLTLALLSPLHTFGELFFSVHMVQHELILLFAAPLMVLGSGLRACIWALPARGRRVVGRWIRARVVWSTWRAISGPTATWIIHGLTLWGWHVPPFYNAALEHEAVHAAQHITFVAAAVLFWRVMSARLGREPRWGALALYLFTTMAHTGVLGALLTFAPVALYARHAERALFWGVAPLHDQQIGGLIMWVPGGFVYLVATLYLVSVWLRSASPRVSFGHTDAASPRR